MDDPSAKPDESQVSDDRDWVPTFFLAGYQKTASTWLYHCFSEHPEIYVPDTDGIYFFDIYDYRGLDCYRKFFDNVTGQRQIGDTTPTYMRHRTARRRMVELNPSAKFIVTVRNPIERAFSHYWHEKKYRTINYRFDACLSNNVDIFDDWIATGFYDLHLTDLFTMVSREQVLVLFYDDLVDKPRAFLRQALRFLEVDEELLPSMLNVKVNRAWYRPSWGEMFANLRNGRPLRESEYDRGIDPEFRAELQKIYCEHNAKLGELVGRDLSHWI